MARRRNKQAERMVARRRIRQLLDTASRRLVEGDRDHARRAVALARRIAMRYQTGLAPHQRDRICSGCQMILVPGRNARVRVGSGAKRVTCLECGTVKRRGYLREQKERRKARMEQNETAAEAGEQPPVIAGQGDRP